MCASNRRIFEMNYAVLGINYSYNSSMKYAGFRYTKLCLAAGFYKVSTFDNIFIQKFDFSTCHSLND